MKTLILFTILIIALVYGDKNWSYNPENDDLKYQEGVFKYARDHIPEYLGVDLKGYKAKNTELNFEHWALHSYN